MTAPLFSPGQVIAGKYSVRGLMGFSGATATYAVATQDGREVALKLFSPVLTDRPEVLSVLQRAAAVTAALPADSSSPVLDTGFDTPTRAPYTTTEILAFPSLAHTVFRGGALPVADVVRLLQGIARSVDAAHAQRFAHGALKPQNIFVGQAPERPVRVVDFGVGIARDTVPTGDGQANAAPWLAPEQLRGGAAGPATDVFSAGLVAFFALTGRSFWRSCQGPAPDVAAWQQEILAPRPPPSVRAKEVGSVLSPALDVALHRALAQEPGERFRSVAELAEALASANQPAAGPAQFAATAFAPEGIGPPPPGPWSPAPTPAPQGPYGPPVQAAPPMTARPLTVPPAGVPGSRKGLVIGLVLGGLLLVGGLGVAAVFYTRGNAEAAASASAAAASASAAAAAASASAAAAMGAPAGATGATAADASVAAAPAGSGAPTEAPGATAAGGVDAGDDAPAPSQLTVVCMPDCDTIAIDDAGVSAPMTDPLALDAGAHFVAVTKATYLGQSRKITLKPGQVDKETFFLARPGPAVAKPCGKFLERCPQ